MFSGLCSDCITITLWIIFKCRGIFELKNNLVIISKKNLKLFENLIQLFFIKNFKMIYLKINKSYDTKIKKRSKTLERNLKFLSILNSFKSKLCLKL